MLHIFNLERHSYLIPQGFILNSEETAEEIFRILKAVNPNAILIIHKI